MEQPQTDLADVFRLAMSRETEAWKNLRRLPGQPGTPARRDVFQQWLQTQRLLREAEGRLTAAVISICHDSLRDCAEALRRAPEPPVTATPPSHAALPHAEKHVAVPEAGQVFRGRNGALWDVVAVIHDRLEDGYFLVQVQQRGKPGDPQDVYSEDWTLFCVVNALRGPVPVAVAPR